MSERTVSLRSISRGCHKITNLLLIIFMTNIIWMTDTITSEDIYSKFQGPSIILTPNILKNFFFERGRTEWEGMKDAEDYVDVVDRTDHVTQVLVDSLVNTDDEVTSLQASDVESLDGFRFPEQDRFFAFLTQREGIIEIEGVISYPAKTVLDEREFVD